ncbi:hypothetical protein PR048_007784 [Dryococelus australis]|uniref:Uncharacterized protein n=1 Tax=Dryococelus australis TaxID=614101 RepID=A0ABQ9HV85_9NEOP|nr:hypothetical protein PR048_007784 [Dryococelus australis]
MRAIEVTTVRRQNEGAGETEDPRENPPSNGIVRHDSHWRKSAPRCVRAPSHAAIIGPDKPLQPVEERLFRAFHLTTGPHARVYACACVSRQGVGPGGGGVNTEGERESVSYCEKFSVGWASSWRVDCQASLFCEGPRWCSSLDYPPSRQGKPANIPRGVVPRFSHAGIMPDDAAGPRAFAGVSPFPPPLHSVVAPYLASPSAALKTSMLRASSKEYRGEIAACSASSGSTYHQNGVTDQQHFVASLDNQRQLNYLQPAAQPIRKTPHRSLQ